MDTQLPGRYVVTIKNNVYINKGMKLLTKIPKTYLFLGIVILLIVVISLFEEYNPKSLNNPQSLNRLTNINEKSNKQEKEEGNVTVIVEYLPQKSDKNILVFSISLDTHNVDLTSFDFSKDIMLEKKGLISTPIKSTPSGSIHHRKAEVIFERVESPFSIVLKSLSGVAKREFQFINLK